MVAGRQREVEPITVVAVVAVVAVVGNLDAAGLPV
jgi:hypothetical protein